MPAKKTSTPKKATKKTARPKMKKGAKYQCGVCGIAVTVDEVCGCVEAHNIVCCDKPMKPKKK